MKRNIGTEDRMLRLAIAIGILIFAWWASSFIALALSLFVFYEAIAGWCVFYQILGKSSCSIEKD